MEKYKLKYENLIIHNIRCFKDICIELSPRINIFVGLNNNGKTTMLNCLSSIQYPVKLDKSFNRINNNDGYVSIKINGNTEKYFTYKCNNLKILTGHQNMSSFTDNSNASKEFIAAHEPHNILVPYLSKRKVMGYNESISINLLNSVTGTLQNLYVKIDNISNPNYQPAYSEYIKACDEILGFQVSATSSENGKKGVYIIQNDDQIPLDAMGEGISSLLGLIVDLCRLKNKIYIIEEPENDIHPKALKALLRLISEKSLQNQFFITTHSNIVLKQLGGIDSTKIFNLRLHYEDRIPTTDVEVAETCEQRLEILEELGYEMNDFGLWSFWLFLEEASAERLIREFFIPWFISGAKNKIRTFSAASTSKVKSKFEEFNKLFVYLHLTPVYLNKACVVIDSGNIESTLIQKLKDVYIPSGWKENSFRQFSKHDFEEYYPSRFSEDVSKILSLTDQQQKREAKNKLLEQVLYWIKSDEELAKAEFETSAHEVITTLKEIFHEAGLCTNSNILHDVLPLSQ